MNDIYLDHAATTPLHPEVLASIYANGQLRVGNPSSIHSFGRKARQGLDQARRIVARSIHALETEITFTSGGTEANNLALIGTALANQHKGKHLITTEQEHPSVLDAVRYLESNGFQVTYLPVNEAGQIVLSDLRAALQPDTILVSIMFANNETGALQPIEAVGEILQDHTAYFHVDAVQAYSLIEIDVKQLGIDLLTASSHKINGPTGVGFLYTRSQLRLQTLQFGGIQERSRRPGTENRLGILGFAHAVEIMMQERSERYDMYKEYKHVLVNTLRKSGVTIHVNGNEETALPSILNLSFPGMRSEILLQGLDLAGIAAASGSACTAGSLEPSHVLMAMYGEDDERVSNSIRFSFGIDHTIEIIEEAAQRIEEVITRIMK